MDTSVNKSVYKARTLGAKQYSSYKEGVLSSEVKVFMKLLNATSCHCMKIQTLLSYPKHRKK